MKEVFSIRLTGFERKELSVISAEDNMPIGQLIRESIDRFIAVKRFRQLKKKAMPYAQARGIYTDEDAMATISKKK